jgi:hypothetical protein
MFVERAYASGPRTAFVLSGGASLGALQVGMLEALYERGIGPDPVRAAGVIISCPIARCDASSGGTSSSATSPMRRSRSI